MKVFSNEIVFRGHPDKVCDQISDALLDAYLEKDKASRCGIEVMGGKGKVFVTGEVTSNGIVNVDLYFLSPTIGWFISLIWTLIWFFLPVLISTSSKV